jgi:hypothetical protein
MGMLYPSCLGQIAPATNGIGAWVVSSPSQRPSNKGFHSTKGARLRLCKTAHHSSCISVSFLFTPCHCYQAGLCFPAISEWPNFMCSASTVGSGVVLDCKLTGGPDDWRILCLERMRLIDMAHYWSIGIHQTSRVSFPSSGT